MLVVVIDVGTAAVSQLVGLKRKAIRLFHIPLVLLPARSVSHGLGGEAIIHCAPFLLCALSAESAAKLFVYEERGIGIGKECPTAAPAIAQIMDNLLRRKMARMWTKLSETARWKCDGREWHKESAHEMRDLASAARPLARAHLTQVAGHSTT